MISTYHNISLGLTPRMLIFQHKVLVVVRESRLTRKWDNEVERFIVLEVNTTLEGIDRDKK